MKSSEFIREAGRDGTQMTDAQYAAQQYQGEKNLQGIKNFFAGAPQTGAASNMAKDPAQLGGQGRPENSMDDSDDFYANPFVPPAAPAAPNIPAANPMSQDPVQTAQAAAPVKLPTRPGQQTSGRRSDPAVLKIQQDLIAKGYKIKADGIMGPATQAAQKAAAAPNQSSAETARLSRPAPGAVQQAATPAVDPTKQSVNQRLATGPSLIDQGRARLGIPAGGTTPAAPKVPAAPAAPRAPAAPVTAGATNADRRDFEESVDRMRRLSNMLKG
jgi:hypothetical protein